MLISILKNVERASKENTVELIGFIVREFSHNSNPIEWIAGKYK